MPKYIRQKHNFVVFIRKHSKRLAPGFVFRQYGESEGAIYYPRPGFLYRIFPAGKPIAKVSNIRGEDIIEIQDPHQRQMIFDLIHSYESYSGRVVQVIIPPELDEYFS